MDSQLVAAKVPGVPQRIGYHSDTLRPVGNFDPEDSDSQQDSCGKEQALRHPSFRISLGLCLCAVLLGCGNASKFNKAQADAEAASEGEKIGPLEKRFLDASRPFYLAISSRDYAKGYELLSSHAKQHMSINQFDPADDDKQFAANETHAIRDVSPERFSELLAQSEKRFGQPTSLQDLQVFETDPDILAKKKKEDLDAVDILFAVGNMPDSIPAQIRKASIRGQIQVQLSATQMADAAKAQQSTVDELKKDPDFKPYVTLKVVLVEEGGTLKVGYFEFLPPSMLD